MKIAKSGQSALMVQWIENDVIRKVKQMVAGVHPA